MRDVRNTQKPGRPHKAEARNWLTPPADIPMAKVNHMAKLLIKGPWEELQSHMTDDAATKGRWGPGAKRGGQESNLMPTLHLLLLFFELSWLFFHIKFKVIELNYQQCPVGILIGIMLMLSINLGGTNIFLIFPSKNTVCVCNSVRSFFFMSRIDQSDHKFHSGHRALVSGHLTFCITTTKRLKFILSHDHSRWRTLGLFSLKYTETN